MFEQIRRKNLYVTTLYMTGNIFIYYKIQLDKQYLGNVFLTQPVGAYLWFPRLNFVNLLKELQYLVVLGTSTHIFGPRYLTDCNAIMNIFYAFSPKLITR